MRHTLAQKLVHIGRMIVAWLVAYGIFAFLRVYGIGDIPFVQITTDFELAKVFTQMVVAAVITGILYGSIDLILDRPKIMRLAYGRILAIKTLLNIIVVVVVAAFFYSVRIRWGLIDPDDSSAGWWQMLSSSTFIVFLIYFAIIDFILSAYEQINQKFGRGVLFEMMTGRYHKPKEDQRIFMFIDLKSSVTIAEKLGHVRYSYLLQDCFFDLNTQLSRYRAKVYQYVGDEAVVYWNLKEGLQNNNCINFFFGFLRRLDKRSDYYREQYGLTPFFKAGAHLGKVTIAEIGLLKRDIAFHGDTVNTTSRIQGQCNAFNQRLLVSEALLETLSPDPNLQHSFIGNEILKGKHSGMKLFGIESSVRHVSNDTALEVGRTA